jgi:hypothetical protein
LKYRVIIEGIDPPPSRILQSVGQYIEGCRIWAKSNLDVLPKESGYTNAIAVIYEVREVEVERIGRELHLTLREKLSQLVEEIGTATKVDSPNELGRVEISNRLVELLKETEEGK